MILVSFPLAFLVIRTVKETNYEDEKMVYVNDIGSEEMEKGDSELEKKDTIPAENLESP